MDDDIQDIPKINDERELFGKSPVPEKVVPDEVQEVVSGQPEKNSDEENVSTDELREVQNKNEEQPKVESPNIESLKVESKKTVDQKSEEVKNATGFISIRI